LPWGEGFEIPRREREREREFIRKYSVALPLSEDSAAANEVPDMSSCVFSELLHISQKSASSSAESVLPWTESSEVCSKYGGYMHEVP
jgi:hypothetical protein